MIELPDESYRAIIENSEEVFTIIDDKGVVKYQSSNYKRIWGRDPEGEIGKDLYKDVHPDDIKLISDSFDSLLKDRGGKVSVRVRAKHEDGTWRVLDVAAKNLLDDPAVRGIVVVFRDITKMERMDARLRRSENEKEMILSSLSELVSHQDRDLKVLWANEAAARSVHQPLQWLIGRHCYEVWPQRSQPCENCPVIKAMETGKMQKAEMSTPDGRWWSITGNPVRNEEGGVIGAIEVTTEITERKRREDELAKRIAELEKFQKVSMGREDRILELKQQVKELRQRLGEG